MFDDKSNTSFKLDLDNNYNLTIKFMILQKHQIKHTAFIQKTITIFPTTPPLVYTQSHRITLGIAMEKEQ